MAAFVALPTTTGRVISPQGWRQLPGEPAPRIHHGIDYAGREGDPFFAIAPGSIEAVYYSGQVGARGYGNTIVLRHGPAVLSVYAHAAETRADVGAVVPAGTIIGRIGRTSGRGGDPSALIGTPHLHLEIVRAWPLRSDDDAARYDVAATLAAWYAASGVSVPIEPGRSDSSAPPSSDSGDLLPWVVGLIIIARRRR